MLSLNIGTQLTRILRIFCTKNAPETHLARVKQGIKRVFSGVYFVVNTRETRVTSDFRPIKSLFLAFITQVKEIFCAKSIRLPYRFCIKTSLNPGFTPV